MIDIFEKRFDYLTKFNENCVQNNKNIIFNFQNYIGLTTQKNGDFIIDLEKTDRNILVKIKYFPKVFDLYKNNIIDLPRDINFIISEYLKSYILFEFNISHNDSYPFNPPIWSLVSCKDRLSNYENIIEYYKYIVKSHNVNNNGWSPAITIEKDILYFISKINNFELLMNCLYN